MDFGMMIEMVGAQRDPLDRWSEDPSFRSASTERWYNLRLSSVSYEVDRVEHVHRNAPSSRFQTELFHSYFSHPGPTRFP